MGAKTTRHKGDGLSVRQRTRQRIIAGLRAGAAGIPHAHGNGVLTLQNCAFSTNDDDAAQAHQVKVAEAAVAAATEKGRKL